MSDEDYSLRKQIAASLKANGVYADPFEIEDDILVEGALTDIVKVYLQWRSEIDGGLA